MRIRFWIDKAIDLFLALFLFPYWSACAFIDLLISDSDFYYRG